MVFRHDAKRQVLPGGIELKVPFSKVQTIGNDFVLIEPCGIDYPTLAKSACDRRFGIGSDGLLVLSRGMDSDLDLRMFNPDGSEDFCGNGLRCAGMMARHRGWVDGSFSINHLGRLVAGEVIDEDIAVTLPPASFASMDVPVRTELPEFVNQMVEGVQGTALSTGSAHFIVFVEDLPSDDVFHTVSPKIESGAIFPERISIMWTQVMSTKWLKLRIWERGVGETQGCGTGSSAAAAAWARQSGAGGDILVSNPGGDLKVSLADWTSPIRAISRPEIVFTGLFDF